MCKELSVIVGKDGWELKSAGDINFEKRENTKKNQRTPDVFIINSIK